jgi:hypothetical protein
LRNRGFYYEKSLTMAAKEFVQNETRGGIVVDVGASVGWLTLFAAALDVEVG